MKVAHHREKNRVAILRAFEDMPEIVAMASKKCQNFPDDPALRSAMEGLKAVLLKEIPHLVNILAVRHISKFFRLCETFHVVVTAPRGWGLTKAAKVANSCLLFRALALRTPC